MLTAKPHLLVRRPSPTAAEFTLTTSPPPTLPSRLLLALLVPLRLLAGLFALLILFAKLQLSPDYAIDLPARPADPAPPFFTDAYIWHVLHVLSLSPAGVLASRAAAAVPLAALAPLAALLIYAALRRIHVTEGLLVLRGLGIQTSSQGPSYLSWKATRFIPTENIRDVLVNEAFRGFEVRYYLVLVVEGEEDVVVVFPRLLPSRRIVEAVWRGVRGCLWESEQEKKSQAWAGQGKG